MRYALAGSAFCWAAPVSGDATSIPTPSTPASEVLHRNIDDVLEARDTLGTSALAGGPEAATRHRDGASGGIPNFDLEVRVRSGSRIWVNVSTIVFDNPRTGRRLFVRLERDVDHRRR